MVGGRLLARRGLHEKMLVCAASLTVLFALVMLATLTAFTATVTREGLARTLGSMTFDQVGTRVSQQVKAGGWAESEAYLRERLAAAYGPVPLEVGASARGDSYALPGQEKDDHPELTAFALFSGLEQHARLAEGVWPSDGGADGLVRTVVSVPAAKLLKVKVGDTLRMVNRIDRSPVTATVVGLYEVVDPADPYWHGDRLSIDGVERLGYTTFGPLVVDPGVFARRFAPRGVQASWTVRPDTSRMDAGRVHELPGRLGAMDTALRAKGFGVVSELPGELRQLDTALLVTRSTMLVPVLQLVLLAGYALLLVARLIADQRRAEVSLLRARGASLRQVGGLAFVEGLVLAVPGLVAAPLLAPVLLRWSAHAPGVRSTGLRLAEAPTGLVWVVSLVASVGCAVALAVPTVRSARGTYVESQSGRGRGEARGPLQRAGADLALLVVAGLGMWQLTRYGAPVTSTSGGLGVDPVIVAGPALALLAGGALVLRLVPVASGVAERLAAGGRGLAPALGARQISRRPLRYAGPALLLVMAVAVGILSVTTSGTWRASQVAQADFASGAQVRIAAPSAEGLPAAVGQRAVLEALPGVGVVSPVLRGSVRVGDGDTALLAADAGALAKVVVGEPDLVAALAGPAGDRPAALGVLPGEPKRLELRLRASGGEPGLTVELAAMFQAFVTVVDGSGLVREVPLGRLPADGRVRTLTADLAALAGQGGRLTYPLSLRGVRYELPQVLYRGRLDVAVERVSADGVPVGLPSGDRWRWTFTPQGDVPSNGTPARSGAGWTVGVKYKGELVSPTGFGFPEPDVLTLLLPGPAEAPLHGLITRELADTKRLKVGDTLEVEVGARVKMTVSGVVRALPTTDPVRPAVLVDLAAFNERALNQAQLAVVPSEWWMSGSPEVGAVAGWGWVQDRDAVRAEFRDSPLGAALQGALFLGFLAALLFAVVGFAINATVSVRERVTEFAVLRALGASPRQVFGMLGMEQALLVLLGLAGGLVLGLAVAWLAVPRLVLSVRASAPYPKVDLVVAWGPVAALLAGSLAVLAVVLGLLVARLRRAGAG
ncbi:FtsX-like permease family protein, partial [Actinocorallia lasiicapitis]